MKFIGSPFLSIIMVFIFTYCMYRYWVILSKQLLRYRYLLLSLRSLALLFLLFLLLNPWIDWVQNEQNSQKISVICDLSESMFNHFEDYPINYYDIYDKIKSWGEGHDLKLNFYKLGYKITELDHMEYADLTTDFRAIPKFISFEQPHQVVLITDGKATAGKNINEIEFSKLHPIHALGVGPAQIEQDIVIQDVMIPDIIKRGDSVNLKIKIHTRLHDDNISNLKILNSLNEQVYSKKLIFEKGNSLKQLTLRISTDVLNGLNVATIDHVFGETKTDNNSFSFTGNLQDTEYVILFISGALSQNSSIIKDILSDFENTNIHHSFRLEHARWNSQPLDMQYDNLKMIVLDDFPIDNKDEQLFNEIVELSLDQQIPILYFQGPWGNMTSGEMIRSNFPDFVPKVEDINKLMDISRKSTWITSNVNLNKFPPQKRSIKWITSINPWLEYVDESLLIGSINNFYLISLPALSINNFLNSENSQSIITQLLNKVFLHAFHSSAGFLRLEADGKSFNKGEIINLSLNPLVGLDLNNYSLQTVYDGDTLLLECDDGESRNAFKCSTASMKPGEYTFYAQTSLSHGESLVSNIKSIIIQDMNIEMKELVQEHQALLEIAYKTGGTYAPIDSLYSMLSQIDITPVQRLRNHQISSLSIQNYWWIVILLLSIEWYFRKKMGLL